MDDLEHLQKIPGGDDDLLKKLDSKLREHDEIALTIGAIPLLHRQSNGEYGTFVKVHGPGMEFYLDLFSLCTLLDGEWLSSSAIDGVLAELAVISSGVQLMSSEKTYFHACSLLRNGSISNAINLQPETHTLIFPFWVLGNHWCVASATCHHGERQLTVYNSSPGHGTAMIEILLPEVLDRIIDANSQSNRSHWNESRWAVQKVVQGRTLTQTDAYNCGVYTIFNALALVRGEQPSLRPVSPKELRLKYAEALVTALESLKDESLDDKNISGNAEGRT
ncbi:hypothetical protein MMC07_002363 [Pseudocyphellaria aurata]|nr:hypothetical protein [Pseudocyphellaria aurata]